VLAFDAQVSVFWSTPPDGVAPVGLRDLFPDQPAPGTVPSCAEAGVLGSLTGQVGSVMATEAIKLITGVGDPLLGRVLVLDGLSQRWHEVPLRPAPPAAPATTTTPPEERPVPDRTDDAVPTIDVETARRRAATEQVTFVDVREPDEVAAGAVEGALHVPLARLLTEAGRAQVPHEGLVVAYCKVGPRSERAAAALRADGVDAVSLLGGYPAWSSTP
jgi:sulfur-carrier protein adenylyltransferase/sulfurtransferase